MFGVGVKLKNVSNLLQCAKFLLIKDLFVYMYIVLQSILQTNSNLCIFDCYTQRQCKFTFVEVLNVARR